jgi:hypothetical protein
LPLTAARMAFSRLLQPIMGVLGRLAAGLRPRPRYQ